MHGSIEHIRHVQALGDIPLHRFGTKDIKHFSWAFQKAFRLARTITNMKHLKLLLVQVSDWSTSISESTHGSPPDDLHVHVRMCTTTRIFKRHSINLTVFDTILLNFASKN